MRFTMIYPADENERFASDAFDGNVGKSIRIAHRRRGLR